jgi:hypothetical protein
LALRRTPIYGKLKFDSTEEELTLNHLEVLLVWDGTKAVELVLFSVGPVPLAVIKEYYPDIPIVKEPTNRSSVGTVDCFICLHGPGRSHLCS